MQQFISHYITSFVSDRRVRTSLTAIAADVLLVTFKGGLAVVTGSTVILADAYHSLSDLLVSLILLCSIAMKLWQENKGCAKGIVFAHQCESILSIVVALLILYLPLEILNGINFNHTAINHVWLALIGMLVIIGVVGYMAYLKVSTGRATGSPALEADGYHSLVDALTSVAVLFSLISYVLGFHLDAFVAIAIAVMIAVSGLQLLFSGVKECLKSRSVVLEAQTQ